MGTLLHDLLWERCSGLARRCLEHPFVRGLGDGSLSVEAFRRYVAQDAYYLRAFLHAYAVCTARSTDLEMAATLVDLQRGTLEELKLHASYARELRIDLDSVQPHPAASAYCDYLERTAWHEGIELAIAAMTPCLRLYEYLGKELARDGVPGHRYAEWIRTYSSEDYARHVRRMEVLLDGVAGDTPAVEDRYRYAMRCEIDFFTAPLEEQR
ncbi:MAG: TenA family protein [Acidobacteriota bacterium]